ncbi:MAG: putative zinc-binding metallopeptidase [Pseudomonadota bacterium]
MRLFTCENCSQPVYFENTGCVACGEPQGYQPDANRMQVVREGRLRCENAQHEACNWLVPEGTTDAFCRSCRHNVIIPNLGDASNLFHWRQIQDAQRRAMYSFLRLKLPLESRVEAPDSGLGFEILADAPNGPKVMTAHDFGLITIALAEADDVERSRRRAAMGEPYRTILGHFRHESGHYFWDRLVRDTAMLEPCRAIFGDDSLDYDVALKRHHEQGPPQDWQGDFVSSYATSHPWEDFAETWAHYLHIVDTLEMARSFGMGVDARADNTGTLTGSVEFDPYREAQIGPLMDAWVPITAAVNSLNRCMGVPDLYPFVLSPKVVEKLGFIQTLVHGGLAAAD